MEGQQVARVVIGLAAAVGLAVVAALPQVRRWEQRLGLGVLTASGLPLLLLGYAFQTFGIISPKTLTDLRPAYEFGLGWIGVVVGMQVNVRRLDEFPPWFMTAVVAVTVPPILFAALGSGLVLAAFGALPGTGLIRDIIVLAACAAVSAPANLRLLLRNRPPATANIVRAITRMDQIAAFLLLALAASLFRPAAGTVLWRLPRSGWFLVTIGVGFLLGVIIYLLIRRVESRTEELSLVLGGIALAAGVAGYLALSVPVVCALAGAVLANVPYRERDRLENMLGDVERTIYLLMLFLVGTAWQPLEWQGWVLGVVFAATRAYGKLIGARLAVRVGGAQLPSPPTLALSLLPESAIAILVIFTLATLHGSTAPAVRWAVNAVIIGSVLTEIFVQVRQRRESRMAGEETGPIVTHFV
ncbi:MAG TPA: hypothetical protein VMS98_06525 [Thermoanaerobaculia bacterium]|nr:hypothetical protein [Thermoanaerobaculia bacterium]